MHEELVPGGAGRVLVHYMSLIAHIVIQQQSFVGLYLVNITVQHLLSSCFSRHYLINLHEEQNSVLEIAASPAHKYEQNN